MFLSSWGDWQACMLVTQHPTSNYNYNDNNNNNREWLHFCALLLLQGENGCNWIILKVLIFWGTNFGKNLFSEWSIRLSLFLQNILKIKNSRNIPQKLAVTWILLMFSTPMYYWNLPRMFQWKRMTFKAIVWLMDIFINWIVIFSLKLWNIPSTIVVKSYFLYHGAVSIVGFTNFLVFGYVVGFNEQNTFPK